MCEEVQFLLESYITSENERELESIYKFVSLKDSTYIYRALSILKEYASKNQLIKKVLSDKAKESESRLRDRLLFIVK